MNKPIIFQNSISNEEVALLPAIEFRGPITIIDSELELKAACRYLAAQSVIGFDTETRPSFRAGVVNRVALLQLSSAERSFLFRLCKIPFDKAIIKILENRDILKIGADVKGDLRALHNIRHFQEAGFVDLQELAGGWGIEEKSLRKLSAIVLGHRVSKAQRLSNWEAIQLTDKQQLYAATDAWVCTCIYDRLLRTPKPKKKTSSTTGDRAESVRNQPNVENEKIKFNVFNKRGRKGKPGKPNAENEARISKDEPSNTTPAR